ncbi:MAG: superoxide dismutase [Syntrophomonadaceae bacterium]|nr:superoxide dismutase [Syntrophomonadaceae bacterium]
MAHELPSLAYPYEALEPYYDEETLRLHHGKHHQSYVDGLNKAEAQLVEARSRSDYGLIKHWLKELAFHGSGHILHTLFFENLAPAGQSFPGLKTRSQVEQDFGSFDEFKKMFTAAAAAVEGSGWAVLCYNHLFKKLEILQAEKHQNLTQWGVIPLLVIDMWEHAYYLKYQNRRPEYITAWWNIVNWDIVEERLVKASS